MKLAIIGSRNYSDIDQARKVFAALNFNLLVKEVVSGGAKGADLIGAL